jgi:hypothetical protein
VAKRSSKKKIGQVPGSIVDLVDNLGGALAFRVLEIWGGSIVWVPTQAAADHPMRKLIGDEGFELLVTKYKGTRLELPKNDAILRQHRYKHVQELRERGHSLSVIAMQSNYSRRQVINIVNSSADAPPQLGLFDDYQPARDLEENHAMPSAHNPFGIGCR